MKKTLCVLFAFLLIIALVSCNKAEKRKPEEKNRIDATTRITEISETETTDSLPEDNTIPENEQHSKILIAYFTWAENTNQDGIDAVTSASVKIPGNVAMLASWIAEDTEGDLFSIQVADPYPSDWDKVLSRANQEKADEVHPELIQTVSDMDKYTTVFLGYPNWWYSCPMAVLSFIEENDLSGKQIYLFCSHGTGGLAKIGNPIR